MRTNRWNLALGLGLILAAALACNFNFSTANISSLKIGKDEKATTDTATFGPGDKIYIIATLSNTSDKWKLKSRLYFDDVQGQKSGDLVPGSEIEKELPGAGVVYFTYTGTSGLPNGKYKVEVTMVSQQGEEKDKKSGTLTIAGNSSGSSSSSNSNMSNMNMSDSDNDNK